MNLLIVDDQPNVIAALTLSIDWQAIGIDKVFTAGSVQQAKNIIEEEHLDILMTDIEMPIENGLSLVKWIGSTYPDIRCIVITSHPDFAYAKQAISLNVCEYIVQPAKNEEVIAAVRNAMRRIYDRSSIHHFSGQQLFTISERNFAAKRFLETWPNSNDPEFEEILARKQERIRNLNIPCQGQEVATLLLVQIQEWHTIPIDSYSMIFPLRDLLVQSTQAIEGRSLLHFRQDNTYAALLLSEPSDDSFPEFMQAFQDAVYQKFQCVISTIYVSTNFYNIREAFDLLMTYWEKKETLPVGITTLDLSSTRKDRPLTHSQYFEQINQYIDSHIEEVISRTELADHIHVSSDYLSHIVRQTTEDSLKNLIMRKKMAHARDLLKSSDLPVGEIAAKCGYDSFAYFSKVYKTMFNESPTDTRKNP